METCTPDDNGAVEFANILEKEFTCNPVEGGEYNGEVLESGYRIEKVVKGVEVDI